MSAAATAPLPTAPGPSLSTARRWTALALIGAGTALVPWMAALAVTLPPRAAVAWVTLDAFEALCLLTAGAGLLRRGRAHRAAAGGAALLLTADACVDVLTAAPGTALGVAVAMALCAELPCAALCAALAREQHGGGAARVGRRPRR